MGSVGEAQAHENMQPFVALTMILSTRWTARLPAGAIVAFSGTASLGGWVVCNGTAVDLPVLDPMFQSRAPDLEGRVIIGAGEGAGLTVRTLGERGGSEFVTLSVAELPAHKHDVLLGLDADSQGPTGLIPATIFAASSGPQVFMSELSVKSAGGGSPHNNMGPSLAMVFLMALSDNIPPVGAVVNFAGRLLSADAFGGEMRAWGQVVDRTDILSTIAGGFRSRVPDSRNVMLAGRTFQVPIGSVFGSETHRLSTSELPEHNHPFHASTTLADGVAGPSSVIGRVSGTAAFAPASNLVSFSPAMGGNSGNGTAHDNLQPFYVMDTIMYCSETCVATLNNTQCVCDLMTGYCSVQTLSAAPLVITGPTTIPNGLTLQPSSLLVVNASSGGAITVQGPAILNGTLTVVVASSSQRSVTVLSATSVTGSFDTVNVVPNYQTCGTVQGISSYSSTTVSVTIQNPDCASSSSTNTALIVGLVVGIVGAAIVAIVIGVIVHRARNKAALEKMRSKISSSQSLKPSASINL